MAPTDQRRPPDPRDAFGRPPAHRITESHVAPGVAKAHQAAAHGHQPPLAPKPPEPAPLARSFQREG